MISFLTRAPVFPPVEDALQEPNGLLCAGGDLSPARLLSAYRHGIFPWYSPGEPILWWSPDPRMVLFPASIKISRSLAKTLRHGDHEIRLDTSFPQVMAECAAPRDGQAGTWISDAMQLAYTRLHELGHAHSVETWRNGELTGGLYGVALGRVFYGESMFSRESNASKIALAHLCRFLQQQGYALIDCQMKTPHLASLGASEIPRTRFIHHINQWADEPILPGKWPEDGARALFRPENTR